MIRKIEPDTATLSAPTVEDAKKHDESYIIFETRINGHIILCLHRYDSGRSGLVIAILRTNYPRPPSSYTIKLNIVRHINDR